MSPQVSIIVPVFNVELYLSACLDSLRRQTCSEIEIICVDDASTDGSLQILTEASGNDTRIKVVRHPVNRGLSAARNTGIKAASAPWILFVDSDDLVSERVCERTLSVASQTGADVVFFAHASFVDGNTPPPEPPQRSALQAGRRVLLRRNAFAWTKLISAELMRAEGIEFPEGLCFEDVPVHWRLALDSSKPVFLDEALVWYRQRPGSITYRKDWSRADGLKIYDLVRAYLHASGKWACWREVFLQAELANFANTHAYYAIANRSLVSRVRNEALSRMTVDHWQVALKGEGLLPWQRDYVLSQCQLPGVKLGPTGLMPAIRQSLRDPLRRLLRVFHR